MKKGSYGYIKAYKKNKLLWSLLFATMIAAVVLGTLLMFGDTKRVIILIAILLSLPFSKFLIGYIMVVRFSSMDKDKYQSITNAKDIKGLCFDLALAHYEGIRFYSSMCINNGKIYAYIDDKSAKKDWSFQKKEYEKWIRNVLETSKYNYSITLFTDFEKYKNKLHGLSEPNEQTRIIDKHVRELILSNCL